MSSEEADKQRRRALMLRAVQDQLDNPQTPEVRLHYQRLLSLGESESNARELIATVLAIYIWHVHRGDAYTYADYVSQLAQLPEIDWGDDDDADA